MLLQLDFMLAVCYGGHGTISYLITVDSNIQTSSTDYHKINSLNCIPVFQLVFCANVLYQFTFT